MTLGQEFRLIGDGRLSILPKITGWPSNEFEERRACPDTFRIVLFAVSVTVLFTSKKISPRADTQRSDDLAGAFWEYY